MKKFLFPLTLVGLLIFSSCGKNDDGPNRFTYKGVSYPIDSIILNEMVFNDGTADEGSIYQFGFFNFNHGDTTRFLLAIYDENIQELDGNYPSVLVNSDETRRIITFAFIVASGIGFQNDTYVYTGEGGSVDVKNNNGTYTIKFNNISVGVYSDMLDTNDDNNVGYTEVSTIGGVFKGVIDKNIYILSKNNDYQNPLMRNFK